MIWNKVADNLSKSLEAHGLDEVQCVDLWHSTWMFNQYVVVGDFVDARDMIELQRRKKKNITKSKFIWGNLEHSTLFEKDLVR